MLIGFNSSNGNAPVNVNHSPPPPGHSGGCNIPTVLHFDFYPGGIWTVSIPTPRASVSKARRVLPSRGVWGHAPPRKFCNCFCWMRARLACLLSLLTHNVDRYLIYLKLYLFWEFTRVKIGVSNIKVTFRCDGRRLILKTFNLLWWRPPQCVPWRSW